MGDAVVLKRGGSPGSGVIHVWKEYNLNTSTKYVWDKWSLSSTTTYKWEKYNVESGMYETRTAESGATRTFYWGDKITAFPKSYFYMANDSSRGYGYRSPNGSYNEDSKQFPTISGVGSSVSGYFWYDAAVTSASYRFYTKLYELSTVAEAPMASDSQSASVNYIARWTVNYGDNKGSTSYGQVTASYSWAYPSNGVSGSYWYESVGSSTSISKGSTKYDDVSSTSSTAYPNGGASGSYWYDNRSSSISYSQGSYVDEIFAVDSAKYPQNGRSGSYWYVYDGEAN